MIHPETEYDTILIMNNLLYATNETHAAAIYVTLKYYWTQYFPA